VTFNRDQLRRMAKAAAEAGAWPDDLPNLDEADFPMGTPDREITTRVDVGDFLDQKRASMAAHASQVQDTGFLLALDPVAFRDALGTEWYIRRGVPSDHRDDDVFAGVDGA
jgi:LmbE family N-acetylglucosaminyl deacetylase